jgi:hypothetical protein
MPALRVNSGTDKQKDRSPMKYACMSLTKERATAGGSSSGFFIGAAASSQENRQLATTRI